MKTVHLLRHAKAEPEEVDSDHARPLAKRGRRAAEDMAQYLIKRRFTVERVFCSTATRARQTLEGVRPALEGVPAAYRDALYMIAPEALLRFIQTLPDNCASALLVGHNPTFHEVAVRLVGKAERSEDWRGLRQKFPTGALCSIAFDATRWGDVVPRSGALVDFVRPRDLE